MQERRNAPVSGLKAPFGTPTTRDSACADGVTRHLPPEDCRTFARYELTQATPWERGVCFLPECSARFEPSRDWQLYCCKDCERKGVNEMRRWGHRLALPALVWRIGKYERDNAAVMSLTRAARRHFTQIQSAWLSDRLQRAEAAFGGGDLS